MLPVALARGRRVRTSPRLRTPGRPPGSRRRAPWSDLVPGWCAAWIGVLGCGEPAVGPEPCPHTRTCDAHGCWQELCGGTFRMGSPAGDPDEQPVHTVRLRSFEILATEVTIGTWNACVAAGRCREKPGWAADRLCTRTGDHLPITCIDWFQARDLCAFAGGRLPSEAEWEYAARSEGLDRIYPWGRAEPACDRLVLDVKGCGLSGLQPPCSTPAGNTAHGLCDMAGNAFEWTADWFHPSYRGAPADGTPWDDAGELRVMRGGGIGSDESVRTRSRTWHAPGFSYPGLGVRCVRQGPVGPPGERATTTGAGS